MFKDSPAKVAKLSVANGAARSGSFSVFGADIVIKGDVTATADLHIDGRVEGDIDCGSLVQGEGGQVTGAIRADSAHIAGEVDGSVNAREIVVRKTARVRGDLRYEALTIEHGARIDGHCAYRDDAASLAEEPILTLAS